MSPARKETIAEGTLLYRLLMGSVIWTARPLWRYGLAVVLVGEDPASAVYVRSKGRATVEVGMNSYEHRLPAETSQAELLALIAPRPLYVADAVEDIWCDPDSEYLSCASAGDAYMLLGGRGFVAHRSRLGRWSGVITAGVIVFQVLVGGDGKKLRAAFLAPVVRERRTCRCPVKKWLILH